MAQTRVMQLTQSPKHFLRGNELILRKENKSIWISDISKKEWAQAPKYNRDQEVLSLNRNFDEFTEGSNTLWDFSSTLFLIFSRFFRTSHFLNGLRTVVALHYPWKIN
jgi:hypothetical protein